MKKILLSLLALISVISFSSCKDETKDNDVRVHSLTTETFKTQVGDYTVTPWKCSGELPMIIDFYTDWCVWCPAQEKHLWTIAREYYGKINIYRIHAEEEASVASFFKVDSYPALLLVPKEGKPTIAGGGGLLTADQLRPIIDKLLLNK